MINDSVMKQSETDDKDLIKRTFWMKGDIIEDKEEELTVSISFRCDVDSSITSTSASTISNRDEIRGN